MARVINNGRPETKMIGVRFGKLVVTSRQYDDPRKGAWYNCACDCGVEFRAIGGRIRNGEVLSCGCAPARIKQSPLP